MNVSKDDAGRALEIIDKAGERMETLKHYARAAPFLFVWGSIWVIANTVTDAAPARSDNIWLAGTAVGVAASALLSLRLVRRTRTTERSHAASPRAMTRRFAMTAFAICCFFPATSTILGPLTVRQGNAFLSLLWACVYMAAGAWLGWRLFVIGVVAAAATMFGYLTIEQHYYLWMGVCGGGSLIAGGLWLRKT